MAASLNISGKEGRIDHLPHGAKIVKIGPVDTEIAFLREKKIKKKKKKLRKVKYYYYYYSHSIAGSKPMQ